MTDDITGQYNNLDDLTRYSSRASFYVEYVGIVYDCADDAFGVGDGARDARGRWGENILGDGFRGVGFGGLCLGG